MSEVDDRGNVSSTFTDVSWPYHLSTDSQGQVIVADYFNDRVLLMNDKLQLLSQVKVEWYPRRLCYNELTSQLFVIHSSKSGLWSLSDTVSLFTVR